MTEAKNALLPHTRGVLALSKFDREISVNFFPNVENGKWPTPVRFGWLHKRRRARVSTFERVATLNIPIWQKRYFVLYPNGLLLYYVHCPQNPSEFREPVAVLDLLNIDTVEVDESPKEIVLRTKCPTIPEGEYIVRAPTADLACLWFMSLRETQAKNRLLRNSPERKLPALPTTPPAVDNKEKLPPHRALLLKWRDSFKFNAVLETTEVQFAGYLEKSRNAFLLRRNRSSAGIFFWQRRWFVLRPPLLLYYASEEIAGSGTSPLAALDLRMVQRVELEKVMSIEGSETISLCSSCPQLPGGKYILRATNKNDRQNWFRMLQRTVQNEQEKIKKCNYRHRVSFDSHTLNDAYVPWCDGQDEGLGLGLTPEDSPNSSNSNWEGLKVIQNIRIERKDMNSEAHEFLHHVVHEKNEESGEICLPTLPEVTWDAMQLTNIVLVVKPNSFSEIDEEIHVPLSKFKMNNEKGSFDIPKSSQHSGVYEVSWVERGGLGRRIIVNLYIFLKWMWVPIVIGLVTDPLGWEPELVISLLKFVMKRMLDEWFGCLSVVTIGLLGRLTKFAIENWFDKPSLILSVRGRIEKKKSSCVLSNHIKESETLLNTRNVNSSRCSNIQSNREQTKLRNRKNNGIMHEANGDDSITENENVKIATSETDTIEPILEFDNKCDGSNDQIWPVVDDYINGTELLLEFKRNLLRSLPKFMEKHKEKLQAIADAADKTKMEAAVTKTSESDSHTDIDSLGIQSKTRIFSSIEKFESSAEATIEKQMDRITLLKFLNARDLNLKKAEKMFWAHISWRYENDVDNILDWQPPYCFQQFFPGGILGETIDRRLVLMNGTGWVDVPGLHKALGGDQRLFLRCCAWRNEFVKNEMRKHFLKTGRSQVVVIDDIFGVNSKLFRPKYLSLIKASSGETQDNYPELLHKLYFLRAPSFVHFVWTRVIQYFLDEGVRRKICITPRTGYQEALLPDFEPGFLPNFIMSETLVADDEKVTEIICPGGIIPEEVQNKPCKMDWDTGILDDPFKDKPRKYYVETEGIRYTSDKFVYPDLLQMNIDVAEKNDKVVETSCT